MRLRALGSIGLGMVTAMLLVAGAACSSDDDGKGGSPATGGSPAGGSAAGGGGAAGVAGSGGATGSDYQADAETICRTILPLGCSNDQASTCVSSWTTPADVQAQAGCGTQEKAFYDCLALLLASDFMCSDSGYATYKPGVCLAEQAALGDCTG